MPDPTQPIHPPAEAVTRAWRALREHLARKTRRLNDEVSSYPTPIAHCDDQLPQLLEERARAVRRLRAADEADAAAAGAADRFQRLARFLGASDGAGDDGVEDALRRRLADALSDAIGRADPPIPE